MGFLPADFHFLRPLWLFAAVPAGLLFWWLGRLAKSRSGWSRAVDRTLLPHLLETKSGQRRDWIPALLLIGWLLATLALAGPAWEKRPQPIRKKAEPLVIIQDLSLSMYASDLSPNRLTRARHKLLDLLAERREGTTALVVYSGDAHVVAPLTDDTRTISALVPDLSPSIMPAFGSNLPAAINLALQLLKDGSTGAGRLLLITDEVENRDVAGVNDLLAGKDVVLAVLGVGTEEGGPIPKSDGGFLSDDRGEIVVPRLNRDSLRNLASANGGRYCDIHLDDTDIEYLLAEESFNKREEQYRRIDREFDQWREEGFWLVLALLPLALLAFRRGWLLGLLMILLLPAPEARAMNWQDLWLRKDQQGVKALEENKPGRAAELFKDPQWQGVAEYRAGNYEGAAKILKERDSGESKYNRGNALARQGRLREAIEAYDQALEKDPGLEDARYNRKLIEKMLQQQQQRGSDQGKDEESSGDRQGDKKDRKGENGSESAEVRNRQGEKQDQSGEQSRQQKNRDSAGEEGQGEPQRNAPAKQSREDDSAAVQQSAEQEKDAEAAQKKDNKAAAGAGEERKDQEQQKDNAEDSVTGDRLSGEEQQAVEHWLRRIPDNPGGLLKRKFEYQYRQSRGRERNQADNRKIW